MESRSSNLLKFIPRHLLVIFFLLPSLVTANGSDEFTSGKVLKRFEGQHIYGLSLYHDLIAVALENSIVLSQFEERNGTLVLEESSKTLNSTGDNFSSLLEFKLVNYNSVFYCTDRNCRLCDFRTQKCTTYAVEGAEGKLNQIKAEVLGDHLLLRAVRDGANASIFAFDQKASKDTFVQPSRIAQDHINIVNHKVVGSFQLGGYTYFLGSAKRNDLPYAIYSTSNKADRQRTDVRLTRVCNGDQTSFLESRIDIVLSCDGVGLSKDNGDLDDPHTVINNVATAMTVTNKFLYVVVHKKDEIGRTVRNVVCGYELSSLLQSFDSTWEKCQNVENAKNQKDECEDAAISYTSMPDECYMFSWEKNQRINLCERFNKGVRSDKFKNCELSKAKSTADRNGWLENFKPFEGKVIARLSNFADKIFVSIQESPVDPETLFLLSSEGDLIRITRDTEKAPNILWRDEVNKTPYINYSNNTHHLFYPRFGDVKYLSTTCKGFYEDCEKINYEDPLMCGWCAHPDGQGYSLSDFHRDTCASNEQLLKEGCPPAIKKVVPKDNNWLIAGTNLRRFHNLKVDICGKPCKIENQDDTFVNCNSDIRKSDACDVTLHGDLPDYNNFTLRYTKFEKLADGSDETSPKPTTSTAKEVRFIVAIVSVIVLVIVVIFLWVLYKKYYRKIVVRNIKERSNSKNTAEKKYKYLPSGPNGEHILEELNDNELDPDRLIKLRKLGEGFSAIVYLMSYRPDGKNEIQVAVKNIHNIGFNMDDALREIKLISDCQHPNIVHFIGYFKDPKFDSIHLVTEYMPGGNLYTYLREPSNKPTIGDCFSYILQIADGMDYLGRKRLVHRDLATRNCLLDITNKIVKITDFGLSRKCNIDYDYISQTTSGRQVNLPIRWTAIEVLRDPHKFSDLSDVWSYGVVLWEIFMRAELPYNGMNQEEIKTYLFEGRRLEQPPYAPDELYKVMCRCWEELPSNRPKFPMLKVQINAVLEHLQNQSPGYLAVEYERPNSKIVDSGERPTSSTPVVNSEAKLVDQTPV